MKKTKVVTLIAMVLNIVLLVVLIAAVANIVLNRDESATVSSSTQPGAASGTQDAAETMGGAGDDDLDAWIFNMKELAQKHSVNAHFLQELFPHQVVYKFDGQIIYHDINDALAKNSYDWDSLSPIEDRGEDWRQELTAYTFPIQHTGQYGNSTIFGIDVSKYQDDIDWQAVKDAGVQYAFVRAGYRGYGNGEIKDDERFEEYMEGAAAVGMPVGIYFFSQAVSVEEAIEEADYVLKAIEGYDISWPVVFDMEEIDDDSARTADLTAAAATDIALAFCERIESSGYTPMIYGNVSWFLSMTELERLEGIDKWFAQYRPFPWYPYDFSIWQYSATGKLDGIAGEVDLNISFVDYGAQG